jgi:uncharacterized Zn-finger protein
MQTVQTPPASVKITYPQVRVQIEDSTNKNKISCSGKDEHSKHPKVYFSLKNGSAKCSYCGVVFKL